MQKVFRVTVDISKKIPAPAFEVNTNDLKSVKLEITITNGQSLLDLTDVTPRINIRKPDNEVIFQDCEIVDAKAGKVQIILENQAYLVPGTHTAEIACYKGNEITAITGTFSYKSIKGIMNNEAVESKSEFTAIDRKIEAARKLLEDIGENGVGVDEQARQEIQEVTAQLVDTVKEVNGVKPTNGKVTIPVPEVDTSNLRTKTEKLNLEDMSPEALAAIEGGEGTSFNLLSIPQDGSVTPSKTTFFKFSKYGKNLYNPKATDIQPKTVLNANGTTTANNAYETTGYIPVKAGDVVYFNRVSNGNGETYNLLRAYGFYDVNKVWISGESSTTINQQTGKTAPSDGYVRATHSPNDVGYMISIGSKIAYEPYREYYDLNNISLSIKNDDIPFLVKKPISRNLYNPNAIGIANGMILNVDGSLSNLAGYETTDWIEVDEGDEMWFSRESNPSARTLIRAYVFFDENKVAISGESSTSISANTPKVAPEGTRYMRVSHDPQDVKYQIEVGSKTNYVPYKEGYVIDDEQVKMNIQGPNLTVFSKNKMVVNGDSIPAGYYQSNATGEYAGMYPPGQPYPSLVATQLDMKLVNFSIGGSSIAVKESDPTSRNPIVTRYTEMDNDADIVFIAGGTNDWNYTHTPVGTFTDRTNYTFYGALHNLCLGLIEKYSGKPIVFCTPIKRIQTDGTYPRFNEANGNGLTLEDYANIIKEVCGYYSIPVLDLYNESGINPHIQSQITKYIPDGVHPNSEGHKVIARRVSGYLKQLA